MTSNSSNLARLLGFVVVMCCLVVAGIVLPAQNVRAFPIPPGGDDVLPPRFGDKPFPTATPSIITAHSSTSGAKIQLQLQFPYSWAWDEMPARELQTVVQWRDSQGEWHNVNGWQGNLDKLNTTADSTISGEKSWWVSGDLMGKGTFRWTVNWNNTALATSEPFSLPVVNNSVVVVEVVLE